MNFLIKKIIYIYLKIVYIVGTDVESYKFNRLDEKETFNHIIRGRSFYKIGVEVKNFTNLTYVRVENTNIDNLPKEFSYLKNLKRLYLHKNKFIKVPVVVGEMYSLRELNINEPFLQEIRINIAQLCNLRELYITAENKVNMPNVLSRLVTIQKIFLYRVNLTKFLDFSKCTNLVEINLIKNNLKFFPMSITKLKNLRELCIIENQIIKLPNSINRLQKLQLLYLHNTELKSIPDVIGKMKNLKILSLKNNLLKSLPLSITDIQDTLFKLNLCGNKINDFPGPYVCKIHTINCDFKKSTLLNFKNFISEQKNLHKQDLKNIFKEKLSLKIY